MLREGIHPAPARPETLLLRHVLREERQVNMQRTKAERAPIVAELMARRYDMGLCGRSRRPAKRQRHGASHPWRVAVSVGCAEARAKRAGSAGRAPALTEEQVAEALRLRTECAWTLIRIAEHFGVSKMTVGRRIGNGKRVSDKSGNPETVAAALRFYAERRPLRDLKAALGISTPTYYRILSENGVDVGRGRRDTGKAAAE